MALFKRKTVGRPGEWFFNVEDGKVEEGPQSPGKDRMGPYATREEAEHALETARERTSQWENDPRWRDGSTRGGSTPDDSTRDGSEPGDSTRADGQE